MKYYVFSAATLLCQHLARVPKGSTFPIIFGKEEGGEEERKEGGKGEEKEEDGKRKEEDWECPACSFLPSISNGPAVISQ